MDEGPRRALISSNDHGPLLAMITWWLGCTLVLATATRLGIRIATRNLPTVDDFLVVVASVIAIGGTIAISFAVDSGLGKKLNLLSTAALEDIEKELYVTTILYVGTIGISKISVVTFLGRLTFKTFHKSAVVVLGILIICWTVAFTVGIIFQCDLPRPWDVLGGNCIPMLPFWLVASIVDIITDIAMILLPIHIVCGLQLPARKRSVVIFIFTLRALLILLTVARIVLLERSIDRDVDISFDNIPLYITTQTHATLSVIVACSPALKPFMDNVRTGMLSASINYRCAATTFGEDTWRAHHSNTSHTAIWAGELVAPKRRLNAPASFHSNDDTIYVPDTHGRIIAKPKPTSPPSSSLHTAEQSKQVSFDLSRKISSSGRLSPPRPSTSSIQASIELSRKISSSVRRTPSRPSTEQSRQISFDLNRKSSSSGRRSPPRPPPPPEELRPDLTPFMPRCLGTTTPVEGQSSNMQPSRQNSKSREGRIAAKTKEREAREVQLDRQVLQNNEAMAAKKGQCVVKVEGGCI